MVSGLKKSAIFILPAAGVFNISSPLPPEIAGTICPPPREAICTGKTTRFNLESASVEPPRLNDFYTITASSTHTVPTSLDAILVNSSA